MNKPMKTSMKTCHLGFTLIEILIALFVFTLLAGIVLMTIQYILTWRESMQARANELAKLQVAMVIIERDLQQLVDRNVLTATDEKENAVEFNETENEADNETDLEIQVNFTRMGYANPLNLQERSTLQRVGYHYADNRLSRLNWNALDRTDDDDFGTRVLLEDVSDLTWTFYDKENVDYTSWPPTARDFNDIPTMIALSFNFSTWGKVETYMLIPAHELEFDYE